MSLARAAIDGRNERKMFLLRIITNDGPLTKTEAKGIFTKSWSVSNRTFAEYLQDLIDEGRIKKVDSETGMVLYMSTAAAKEVAMEKGIKKEEASR